MSYYNFDALSLNKHYVRKTIVVARRTHQLSAVEFERACETNGLIAGFRQFGTNCPNQLLSCAAVGSTRNQREPKVDGFRTGRTASYEMRSDERELVEVKRGLYSFDNNRYVRSSTEQLTALLNGSGARRDGRFELVRWSDRRFYYPGVLVIFDPITSTLFGTGNVQYNVYVVNRKGIARLLKARRRA